MSAVAGAVPARESAPPRMRWGFALLRLLRRPAAYAWVPLSAVASLVAVWLATIWLFLVGEGPTTGPVPAVYIAFAAFIGTLVGQAVRELLHCPFSWALPGLRRRLLPGALAVGLAVSLFAREIFVAMLVVASVVGGLFVGSVPDILDIVDIWSNFPPFSLGFAAATFMAFWIGVRPSVNVVFLLLPLTAVSPWLFPWVATHTMFTLAVTAPLTIFLIRDTFGIAAARRQPFVATRPLSGAAWSRGGSGRRAVASQRRERRARGTVWGATPLGASTRRWIHAGWYENHGAGGRLVGALTLLIPAAAILLFAGYLITTMFTTPRLWFIEGYGRLMAVPSSALSAIESMVIGWTMLAMPLAIFTFAYASISLRRTVLYPRARRALADLEYFSSLAETAVVTGLVTAFLLGLWTLLAFLGYGVRGLDRWPPQVGGQYGWVLALLRVLAAIVIAAPIVQYYRLRDIRAPHARSPVTQLLTVFALTAVITTAATLLALRSLWLLPHEPLVVHVAIFATAALITQYLYRRALERYFARADLV